MPRTSSRIRLVVLALIAAIAMAIAPAAAATAAGPGTATITVTGDAPVTPFAIAFIDGPEGHSSGVVFDGSVSFTDLALGSYVVTLPPTSENQGGSVAFELTAEAPDFTGELVVTAWPTGTASISGVVADEDGTPIPFAQVAATSGPRQFPAQTTGPDGTYTFTDLPAGDYAVAGFEYGHFSRSAEVALADGDAATLNLTLPRADSSVSGRLVDENGEPVGDTFVSVTRVGGPADGNAGFVGPDGTYSLSRLGAGQWLIAAGGTGTPYDPATLEVTLTSGENATVDDLVLHPRTTGNVFLFVVDESPSPLPGYPFGICGDLLTPSGNVVATFPGTGGDALIDFSAQPAGTYTVYIYDCDPSRDPGYASQYYGGATTLSGATTFELAAGQDVYLDTTVITVDSGPTEPTGPATAVPAKDLKHANQGDVVAPDKAQRGSTITVGIGEQYADEWVSVWFHDPTTQLGGWHQVAADGTVQVQLPAASSFGQHKLAVQDRDDELIGWTKVNVKH